MERLFTTWGRAYEKIGDIQFALRCYQQSEKTNPAQFNALCNIGSIYLRQDQPQEALKYLLKASELNPNDEITKKNTAICNETYANRKVLLETKSG